MYWCVHCQEYVEARYEADAAPHGPRGPRCPTCRGGVTGADNGRSEHYGNAGNWELSDFHFVMGATHSPTLDRMMITYRELSEAVEAGQHDMAAQRDAAKARVKAYLLAHKSLLIVNDR